MNWAISKKTGLVVWVVSIAIVVCLTSCQEKAPTKKIHPGKETTKSRANVAQSIKGKRVLLVHSYHAQYPWVAELNKGVREALKDTGVELSIHYMDTKRNADKLFMVEAGKLAMRKVSEWKPDIVITADDNAQEFFGMKYVGKQLPIVFCGVNADPSKYGYPARNITGILERCQFRPTVEFFKKLWPTKKIAVLSCNDSTSIAVLSYMKEQLAEANVIEYKLTNDLEEWKRAVIRYNKSVDAVLVYNYHTLKQTPNSTQSMSPKKVMGWTEANSEVPIMGVLSFTIKDGALAGVVESSFEHGELAAGYACKILAGVAPESLPITMAKIGTRMINRNQAGRFKVKMSADVMENTTLVP